VTDTLDVGKTPVGLDAKLLEVIEVDRSAFDYEEMLFVTSNTYFGKSIDIVNINRLGVGT